MRLGARDSESRNSGMFTDDKKQRCLSIRYIEKSFPFPLVAEVCPREKRCGSPRGA